jgi:tRNA threonylcarbamoyladenosine modification (KEOPS) complex  Pcc1 subunit
LHKFTKSVRRSLRLGKGISRVQRSEIGAKLLRLRKHALNLVIEARDVSYLVISLNSSPLHPRAVDSDPSTARIRGSFKLIPTPLVETFAARMPSGRCFGTGECPIENEVVGAADRRAL